MASPAEVTSSHLLKSHSEGTWFTCHICQKKFSFKDKLKEHIQRHEGVKPYVCDECQKCFCTRYGLKLISWRTLTSKGFAVVCVVKILNINIMSKFTLDDVLLFSDMKL